MTRQAEHSALAEMAIDDARKALLDGGPSGRVRIDAIQSMRTIGLSLREAVDAVDRELLYGPSARTEAP